MSNFPTLVTLGDLPLKAGEIIKYNVDLGLSKAPNEILIYTFITLEDTAPSLHRGFYNIYTQKQDGTQYALYMNVAMTKDTVINSQNLWLPYGDGFEPYVYAVLYGPEGTELKPLKKRVKKFQKDGKEDLKAYKEQRPDDEETVVGQVFVTGYKYSK